MGSNDLHRLVYDFLKAFAIDLKVAHPEMLRPLPPRRKRTTGRMQKR